MPTAPGPEIATVDSLKHVFAAGELDSEDQAIPAGWVGKSLFELLVDRTVKPAQMQIVREILTDNSTTDVDTAVFNDIQSNYTIRVTDRENGVFTVTHTTLTDQAVDDGTDTLRNFEKVQFADGTVDVALLLDQPFDSLNITFTDGDVGTLTATFEGLDPLRTVTLQWQALGANGAWTNIAGATSSTFAPAPRCGGARRCALDKHPAGVWGPNHGVGRDGHRRDGG